jgi:amidohydrolase
MSADTSIAQRQKSAARAAVERAADELRSLSHRIHRHPELAFEEHDAARWCAELLDKGGFTVEPGICGLPTAFSATVGSGPLTIALCAEYDALPEIGHACGHNIIAAAGVGAGLALAPLADELGCTIRVLGTPAEEGGGGKILMLERGGFDGVHAAIMVHPAPAESIQMPCLAVAHVDVRYTGKEAHASAYPERGINAADALTLAQVAIGLLRQHVNPFDQVHGIVTLGGAAPNIVPAHTSAAYYLRSRSLRDLEAFTPRVEACFRAGALGTGCELEIVPKGPVYSEFVADDGIARHYAHNAAALGRVFPAAASRPMSGSTDMANVSLAIPSIHPMVGIDSGSASNHQPEFTAACVTAPADRAALEGAIALAWTVIDCALDDNDRDRLIGAGQEPV